MIVFLALVGAVIGFLFLGFYPWGGGIGAVIGGLAGWALTLSRRLEALQHHQNETSEQLSLLQDTVARLVRAGGDAELRGETHAAAGAESPAEDRAETRPQARPGSAFGQGQQGAPEAGGPDISESGERATVRAAGVPVERVTETPTTPTPSRSPTPPGEAEPPGRAARPASTSQEPAGTTGGAGATAVEKLLAGVWRWLTTGNVPVKVGVIVSLFGVAFLIREAIDRGFLVFPLWARLIAVALFGVALLVIGWRLRERRRGYALSVQGGGIAVIYLTTYSAFGLYALIPSLPALLLLVIVTAAAGTLAVAQNSRALAVLGIAGGFLAPILTSTDTGNHVALFSYYAILNAAIFGISWFKAWRLLNVLGFLFTFVIGTAWGYLAYEPSQLATTEPFLVLFVVMYTIIPVFFASKETPRLKGYVDGTLVFGTPVVGFGLQTQLVGDTEYGLAISAVALSALYIGIATYLFRRRTPELRVLTESFLSLSIVFLAITFPLALNARWTSVAWSLQGAAMIWLGIRQQRRLALAAGIVLQIGAAVAFGLQPSPRADEMAILNGHYLGAVLIGIAGLFSGWAFDRSPADDRRYYVTLAAPAFLLWGSAWWLGAGIVEIDRFLPDQPGLRFALIFVAATVWVALLGAHRLSWQRLEWLGLIMIPAMVFAFLLAGLGSSHPLADLGWLAWPIALGTHLGFLHRCEGRFAILRIPLHAAGYWVLAAVLAAECHFWLDRWTDGIWPAALTIGLIGVLIIATLRARSTVSWPVGAHWQIYHRFGAGIVLTVAVLATFVLDLTSPGDPDPLPFVPLLNPIDILNVFVIVVAWYWYSADRESLAVEAIGIRPILLASAIGGLFILTMTVARTVHHWAGVPFDLDSLASSNVLQASLSIVWGGTALAGMIAGAVKRWRHIWIGGATLMAVVVAKLFLVELGNTGTVTRVVSFLGVGILLLIVGYFAPVPPRERSEAASG